MLYQILRAGHSHDLEEQVTEALSQGFRLSGGLNYSSSERDGKGGLPIRIGPSESFVQAVVWDYKNGEPPSKRIEDVVRERFSEEA